jgi:hypothetical protein
MTDNFLIVVLVCGLALAMWFICAELSQATRNNK